jgi:hypothetical protein
MANAAASNAGPRFADVAGSANRSDRFELVVFKGMATFRV